VSKRNSHCHTKLKINSNTEQLDTELNEQVLIESLEEVKEKIKKGADPNWKNPAISQFENTALHHATFKGNAELCKILLENGARTEIENRLGNKPLIFAAYYGHTECARILLDIGADVSAYSSKTGFTALHKACVQGFPEIVKLLLDHGAYTYAFDKQGRTPRDVVGVDGERIVTEGEKRQIYELLSQGGGKRIFSPLHSNHELAFSVNFSDGEACSFCANCIGAGVPWYLCPKCKFQLCGRCLGNSSAIGSMNDLLDSVSGFDEYEDSPRPNTQSGLWFLNFFNCECLTR